LYRQYHGGEVGVLIGNKIGREVGVSIGNIIGTYAIS